MGVGFFMHSQFGSSETRSLCRKRCLSFHVGSTTGSPILRQSQQFALSHNGLGVVYRANPRSFPPKPSVPDGPLLLLSSPLTRTHPPLWILTVARDGVSPIRLVSIGTYNERACGCPNILQTMGKVGASVKKSVNVDLSSNSLEGGSTGVNKISDFFVLV